jgi:amino acid transporter
MGGVWGSYFGLVFIALVLIAQFYIALWPIGGMADDGKAVAEGFFKAYLAVPVVGALTIGGYIWKRTKPLKAMEIDLDVSVRSCSRCCKGA